VQRDSRRIQRHDDVTLFLSLVSPRGCGLSCVHFFGGRSSPIDLALGEFSIKDMKGGKYVAYINYLFDRRYKFSCIR
jgi:hypothetical protein